ncbi:unnamed protein product [Porites evermanni]|uniref:G-patch domain-containing protein n=1 Tax=Porites evermanni TaxID=104178 RepID=A0ABN8MLR6_9CNID|nr:unnamed protein product [Porites evermanni]
MAMLAEKKTKQKWSNDPRNTAWTNDTSRFGYQMLTKMGWESGKGLGANEDGATTHVKATKRRDNLGLGADKSNEDNWLSHQMAFDDLLSKLNDNTESGIGEGKPKGKAKKHDMEKTARQSRKRVFYNRFIQSKDLSSKSAEDMACIFGQRSKSAPGTPQDYSEGEESDESTSSCPPPAIHGVKTITSGQSIQEYFEKKMKELKAAREGKAAGQEMNKTEQASADEIQGNNSANPENCGKESKLRKKKEKRRKRKFSTENPEPQSEEVSTEVDKDERSAKKKKKNEDLDVKLEESENVVQEARKVEKKNRKRKEKNAKMTDFEICDVDVIQSDSRECSTMKDVKPIKEKDKSCKNKDENISRVEKSAIKDKKVKLEKRKDISEEEERKNNDGKKGKKDKSCISHDLANVEFVAKKDRKKKKKKDKSKEGKKRA